MGKSIRKGNRTWAKLFAGSVVLLGTLALVVTFLTPTIKASGPGSAVIIPRDSVAYGRTYSEWSAAWEQWADSIATKSHPLFDNGDCSTAQSGPVWFLGGKFCANNDPTCGTSNVVRTCKMSYGKALYVAVLNSEDSTLEDSANPQIADLRAFTAAQMDGAANLEMDVDGEAVQDIRNNFRVQSPAFGFTLPADNFFTAVGEGPFNAGTYFPGVDDGYYVMLAPLPVGHHEIHFHGANPQWNFVLDITYHVYVHR